MNTTPYKRETSRFNHAVQNLMDWLDTTQGPRELSSYQETTGTHQKTDIDPYKMYLHNIARRVASSQVTMDLVYTVEMFLTDLTSQFKNDNDLSQICYDINRSLHRLWFYTAQDEGDEDLEEDI